MEEKEMDKEMRAKENLFGLSGPDDSYDMRLVARDKGCDLQRPNCHDAWLFDDARASSFPGRADTKHFSEP